MKTVNVGIIGLGNVGKAVLEAILANGELIAKRAGVALAVKGVCDVDENALAAVDEKKCPVKTASADDLIGDETIDVIVELIGGISPAKEIILKALKNKKHVVTANKALLSQHGKEILKAAAENGVSVNFEASVGGAIPVIRALRESFIGNNFAVVYGILNGTTNFILTTMARTGCTFDEALVIAQAKGVAERNPELDISGKDSAHKLAILALLGFGVHVAPDDIFTEGISGIGPQDIEYASRWGYSIKLLAIAKDTPGGLQLRVHPTLLPSAHLLSDVRDVDNAIFLKGDLVGESLLSGKGAGGRPTSSSVIGDIVDIAARIAFSGSADGKPRNFEYAPDRKLSRIESLNMSYYLRFSVIDKPGVLAGISSVLAENNISIASVTQDERKEGETVPVMILTHEAEEGSLRKAIEKINKLDFISDRTVVIRMEEEV